MKKLILVAAIAAATSSAFAMEALDESVLSETTGQAGITIDQGAFAMSIGSLRYTDTDGATGITGVTPAAMQTMINGFNTQGTLQVANLTVSASSIVTTIDIGSGDASAISQGTDRTGIILGTATTGLNVNLGQISLDNQGINAASGGNMATNGNIGGIKLTNLVLPASMKMLILPKGAAGNSGVTIKSLNNALDITTTVDYYDTDVTMHNGTDWRDAGNTANVVDGRGRLTLPVALNDIDSGLIQVDVGTNAEGLKLTMGLTSIASVNLGDGTSTGNIKLAGTDFGSVGINNLKIGGTLVGGVASGNSIMSVRGH